MEPTTFKVVVAGAFGAGKTTLIRHITDAEFVGTEVPTSGPEADIKPTTTVGMEYGTYTIGEGDEAVTLALYGVPGQERFRFMWDIVADGLDGLLLLVDAGDPATWTAARGVVDHLVSAHPVPVVVGVGRSGGDQGAIDEVARAIPVDRAVYLPCEAIDPDSSRAAVVELLLLVLDAIPDPVG